MPEIISINGTLANTSPLPLDGLLAAGFVWQKLTVFGRRVVKAEWAVEVVQRTYGELYGSAAGSNGGTLDGAADLTPALLEREIGALFDALGLPERGGAVAALYIFADGTRVVSCERQLAWREFAHQTGLTAAAVRYDAGFGHLPTASALAAHTCAAAMARRAGADVALREVMSDMPCLVSMGEWPLFGVTGGTPEQRGRIVVPPACDSVQRRLGLAACRAAGLTVEERPLPAAEVATLEELFAATPAGIASICEFVSDAAGLSDLSAIPPLPHSLAARIAKRL